MKHERQTYLDRDKLEGRYANDFMVGHNEFEFVIEFGQYYPGNEGAELCARIITSPAYAKAFFKTFQDSIEQYEREFGTIKGE